MTQTMTMADAGAVQLDIQEDWFNGLESGLEVPETDDRTDEFIERELSARGINTGDYQSEFETQIFADAILKGMGKWYKAVLKGMGE